MKGIFIGPHIKKKRSITTHIPNQIIPSLIDSERNPLSIFPKYNTEKTTTQVVREIGIIVSNKGDCDSLNGKIANATTNGISQSRNP
jgi:hypothetical protein